jgi:hypothetical protein
VIHIFTKIQISGHNPEVFCSWFLQTVWEAFGEESLACEYGANGDLLVSYFTYSCLVHCLPEIHFTRFRLVTTCVENMGEDELRKRIDDELRAYLRCVDEYQTSSAEIAAACKSGLFDIAQTRKVNKKKNMLKNILYEQFPRELYLSFAVSYKMRMISFQCKIKREG